MNRQQRRAAQKNRSPGGGDPTAAPDTVLKLCAEAAWLQQQGKLDDAIRLYRRALALKPDFARAINNLGSAQLAQGKLGEAADTFRRLLLLMPELFDSYADLMAILVLVDPAIRDAMARASAAWPKLPAAEELLGAAGIAAIAGDPLLRCMLESSAVRDIDLERVLTAVRAAVLRHAVEGGEAVDLEFCCALAMQCFVNEYVFAVTPQENEQVERLAAQAALSPAQIAALASYRPMGSWPNADALAAGDWPDAVDDLVTQQLREPREERALRDTMPRLTAIADEVSLKVQRQYEENPYPRWVLPLSRREPLTVNAYLRQEFPTAALRDIATTGTVDMLVAGCGTGQHPIGMARLLKDARLLAVDLSLNSLCYAARKTGELGVDNIEYAQADILQLAGLGRGFDVIDSSGVLHHLADPFAGWRILLGLLRSGGVMRVALYSEIARSAVVAARAFIAERGYRPQSDDIRRCRADLMASGHQQVAGSYDFFSMSECRDLLFHVQEHRMTIPAIKVFLAANDLGFIGFNIGAGVRAQYASRFPDDRAMTNLDHWHDFERDNPATFAAMYQVWMQKR